MFHASDQAITVNCACGCALSALQPSACDSSVGRLQHLGPQLPYSESRRSAEPFCLSRLTETGVNTRNQRDDPAAQICGRLVYQRRDEALEQLQRAPGSLDVSGAIIRDTKDPRAFWAASSPQAALILLPLKLSMGRILFFCSTPNRTLTTRPGTASPGRARRW